jgi:MOSC domain-containing protein
MKIGTVRQIWRYPVKSMAGQQLDLCQVGTLGIPGDRGWAIRDEAIGEIINAKRFPILLTGSAEYVEPPTTDLIPGVVMRFPDGSVVKSDEENVNQTLSTLVGLEVTLWRIQPATDTEHYRRRSQSARMIGRLAKYRLARAALPTLTRFGPANAELREAFSREPDEPVPDISKLPPEILEFTSPPGTYFDAFPIHLITTASLGVMSRLNSRANWDVRRFRPNFFIETDPKIKTLIEAEWEGQKIRLGEVELECTISTMRCGMTLMAQDGLEKDPSILRSIVKDADQNLGIYAKVSIGGEVKVGNSVELI